MEKDMLSKVRFTNVFLKLLAGPSFLADPATFLAHSSRRVKQVRSPWILVLLGRKTILGEGRKTILGEGRKEEDT